jgi:hypothetical protein
MEVGHQGETEDLDMTLIMGGVVLVKSSFNQH